MFRLLCNTAKNNQELPVQHDVGAGAAGKLPFTAKWRRPEKIKVDIYYTVLKDNKLQVKLYLQL
jgi:hypothetical protein